MCSFASRWRPAITRGWVATVAGWLASCLPPAQDTPQSTDKAEHVCRAAAEMQHHTPLSGCKQTGIEYARVTRACNKILPACLPAPLTYSAARPVELPPAALMAAGRFPYRCLQHTQHSAARGVQGRCFTWGDDGGGRKGREVPAEERGAALLQKLLPSLSYTCAAVAAVQLLHRRWCSLSLLHSSRSAEHAPLHVALFVVARVPAGQGMQKLPPIRPPRDAALPAHAAHCSGSGAAERCVVAALPGSPVAVPTCVPRRLLRTLWPRACMRASKRARCCSAG